MRPRTAHELLVCEGGQANRAFRSRPLLPLALEEFRKAPKPGRVPLRDLLRLDPERAGPDVTEIAAGTGPTVVLCVNGNEAPDWREERDFLRALTGHGHAVAVVDPRGVGRLRPRLAVRGHDYADPLSGVEENVAYNAFLVGKSLLGMRVTDVLAAVRQRVRAGARRMVLCGRRDAALVAVLAAAVEPAITHVAAEELLLSFLPLFAADGYPINAASILPGLLRDFGDIPDVLAELKPRPVLVAAGVGGGDRRPPTVRFAAERFTRDAKLLTDWLQE